MWLNVVASLGTCDVVRHLARQDSRDPLVQRPLQPRRRLQQAPLHRPLPKIDATQIWEGGQKWSDSGELAVKRWSDCGQPVVKQRSSGGQTVVNGWSIGDQTVVKVIKQCQGMHPDTRRVSGCIPGFPGPGIPGPGCRPAESP